MLFGRQKLLLSLLHALGGDVDGLDFQKLLFLYTRRYQKDPSYDFVPYRFGGFSFTSYADKRRLINDGLLIDDDQSWSLTAKGKRAALSMQDYRVQAGLFCDEFGHLRGTPLIRLCYQEYPYYAVRSEIIDKVLSTPHDKSKIRNAMPANNTPGIVTIGYESKSLEAYLNQLLLNGVTLLCDVRRNPISRKYGFSKGTLKKACEGVGVRYEHLAELGIASDRRQQLNDQADYDRLFAAYETNDLPLQGNALKTITQWINKQGHRVAVTCYEQIPQQCHRHIVARKIVRLLGKGESVRHL